jgi:hypothetical protein
VEDALSRHIRAWPAECQCLCNYHHHHHHHHHHHRRRAQLSLPKHHRFPSSLIYGHGSSMNSRLRVSVLCFWLCFLAFRTILCCCAHIFVATVTPPSFAREANHLLFRPPVLPHLLFGCGNISDGSLGVTSLRDTVSSGCCSSASPLLGLWAHHCLRAPWALGSTHPSSPTTSEAG